jgi:UDP-N-acetylmuramoylalanine--D-glutamate ligase
MNDFKGKEVSVIGFGRSGKAAAELLISAGAKVFVSESGDRQGVEPVEGTEFEFGKHSDRIYESSLIVISPGIPITHDVVTEAAKRGIPVIGELELASRFTTNSIVAVTGTNGKTTTAFLIRDMLKAANMDAIACGNLGLPLSSVVRDAEIRTVFVVEVSTFQLETVTTFRPKIGILLNITADHLDRHKNFEEYRDLKFRLFSNQTEDDYAVLNLDDPIVSKTRTISQKSFFSTHEPATVWLKDENILWKETKLFSMKEIDLRWECLTPDYLASIAVGKALEIPDKLIAKGLRAFAGVSHRLEDVGSVNGVRFINNSMCTNPVAFVRTLFSFDSPVILIAGGKKKNTDIMTIAEAMNEKADYVCLMGETAEELSGLLDVNHQIVASMEEAVLLAHKHASKGDTILLSPGFASFDWFVDFRDRGEKFKQAVQKLRHGQIASS